MPTKLQAADPEWGYTVLWVGLEPAKQLSSAVEVPCTEADDPIP
jgi:hypothetical protein